MTNPRSLFDEPRIAELLTLLRRHGPLSRQDLHERMGLRPNTVGDLVEELLAAGVVREREPQIQGKGRPRVPIEIDPDRRRVVGVALESGQVSAGRFNLLGERVGEPVRQRVAAARSVEAAAALERSLVDVSTLAVGLSTTGFVDTQARELLTSSAKPQGRPVSLAPLYAASNGAPLIVENDLQALAVQWMLTHEAEARDDILLLFVRDGAIGAAVVVGGLPIRGCVMGGNELGHTRLPVETQRCYCGHVGCLERIVSTDFLRRRRPGDDRTLAEAAAAYRPDAGDAAALDEVLGYLAMAIGNAINLLRPCRVVLASELSAFRPFVDRLLGLVREAMLDTLTDRVRIDLWGHAELDFARTAGWLALASLYRKEWLPRP